MKLKEHPKIFSIQFLIFKSMKLLIIILSGFVLYTEANEIERTYKRRISAIIGYPDLFGLEYRRNINNFYFTLSPHFIASGILIFENHNFLLIPSVIVGYDFYHKRSFSLGAEILFTPIFGWLNNNNESHEFGADLAVAIRVVPAFFIKRVNISIPLGVMKPFYLIPEREEPFFLFPSFALSVGINF